MAERVAEPATEPVADVPFVEVLLDFARELRSAGLPVGTGDAVTFCTAMVSLDPTDLLDLYWGGRTTLVIRREDIGVYDRVFRRFFLGEREDLPAQWQIALLSNAVAQAVLEVPASEPGEEGGDEQEALMGLLASDVEVLRHKSFSVCTPDELAAVRRIMRRIRLTPPRRRTRRTVRARRGRTPDMRRTIRETMRTHGEPAELYWRGRRRRVRPLVLVLDVSGSMADYSRHLLQFAYSARRAATRVEVFCFGTRLTRLTGELQHRRPDQALERATAAVVDWDGGTRIGDSLTTFVRDWGRRGLCRGAIVVICSDGLDRGDPQVLAAAMERLSLLCHRVVWMNPHKGDDSDFRPSTLGMMVVAPYVDLVLSGHDLHSLEELATLLPDLG